ncbi:MAG: PAS domain S-box protein [Planctomycetes bacterium]|nr:PAS domain S-box protein [Planctomycetota bacterium]
MREVTGRKVAEAALRESEKRYETLARMSPVGIFRAGADGRCVHVNERWCRITGFGPDEAKDDGWMASIHPEDRERVVAEWRRSVKNRSPFELEYRFRRPDGGVSWVFSQVVAEADPSGQVEGYVAAITDITEKRRLEERYNQAQKMEAVGRLAGGVAHDFNNMLTAIIGYSELLLAQLSPGDPMRENVEEIHKAGQRAAGLTRQLLAFSRRQMVEPRVLDLNSCVAGVEKLLRRLIGEDVELVTAPARDLWPVRGDPGQVEQVLMNLAVNSRDAMPQGGKLTIETANVELDVEYVQIHADVRPGGYVLLAISDTGCGMTKEVFSHLFEPFFTTKEKDKGTGLGLATVYGIVKQNGGHICVYSEVGHGTTFKIYLPRAGASKRESSVRPPKIDKRGTETILLVEDEGAVRKFSRKVLEHQGYRVLQAENGEEALRMCERHHAPIDLLVTDVVMPRMGGPELAKRMAGVRPRMKVLYLSGYTTNAMVHQGIRDPDLAFLQKPFSSDALIRKVRETLDANDKEASASGAR